MKAKRKRLTGWVVLVTVVVCSGAPAQTIDIGITRGTQGRAVSVPVTLAAPEAMTAALLRVQYDPAVLENPSATTGTLLTESHLLDTQAPEAGRFNIAVYAWSGIPPFSTQDGILCRLTFDIKADATLGLSPITITASGIPALPASDLVSVLGMAVDPGTSEGGVTVLDNKARADQTWILYE